MATNSLTVLDFNNQGIRFENREEQVWVSLTDMVKASGKQVNHYLDSKSTQTFLSTLSNEFLNNPITGNTGMTNYQGFDNIIIVNKGGDVSKSGTWAIDEVAIDFAQWCSVGFRIWVNRSIKLLLATNSLTQHKLPPADVRVVNLINALEKIGFDINNPRYSQGLKDLTGDMLGLNQNQPKLPTKEVWCGVVERAQQLGYSTSLITKYRTALGKYVGKKGLQFIKEKRLCNGTERPINLYLVNPDLDTLIHTYMSQVLTKSSNLN